MFEMMLFCRRLPKIRIQVVVTELKCAIVRNFTTCVLVFCRLVKKCHRMEEWMCDINITKPYLILVKISLPGLAITLTKLGLYHSISEIKNYNYIYIKLFFLATYLCFL